jgi:hypothetical protein
MAFTEHLRSDKIAFTSSAIFPSRDITYLHSRISQTYITTNHGELSSEVARDEYRHGEGGERPAPTCHWLVCSGIVAVTVAMTNPFACVFML